MLMHRNRCTGRGKKETSVNKVYRPIRRRYSKVQTQSVEQPRHIVVVTLITWTRVLCAACLIGTRASAKVVRCRCKQAATIPGGRVDAARTFSRRFLSKTPNPPRVPRVDATAEIIPCDPLDRLSGV